MFLCLFIVWTEQGEINVTQNCMDAGTEATSLCHLKAVLLNKTGLKNQKGLQDTAHFIPLAQSLLFWLAVWMLSGSSSCPWGGESKQLALTLCPSGRKGRSHCQTQTQELLPRGEQLQPVTRKVITPCPATHLPCPARHQPVARGILGLSNPTNRLCSNSLSQTRSVKRIDDRDLEKEK